MSLAAHFSEARRRAFRAALAFLVGAVAGWFTSPLALGWLRAPVVGIALESGRAATLNFPSISGSFDLRLQMAVTIGVVLASPVWLYQIWAFIVPALTRREKWHAVGFVAAAVPLFLAGCGCGLLILPNMVRVLTSFAGAQDAAIIDARMYYDFAMKLLLVVGVGFVLPVFVVLLNLVGVLSARAIIGSWRVAILAIVVFTAVATPAADVVSMLLLAAPMVLLYLAAAAVAWVHDRRAARGLATLLADPAA